jgi:hypothetical protein
MILRIVQERHRLMVERLELPPALGPSFQPFQNFLPFRMGGLNIAHETGVEGAILSLTPYQDREGMSACVILAIVQGDAQIRVKKTPEQYKVRFERPRAAHRFTVDALPIDTRLSAVS